MATSKTENITLLPYSDRVKLVRDRLANLRRPKVAPLPKPAKVQAAEKLYREWEKKGHILLDVPSGADLA